MGVPGHPSKISGAYPWLENGTSAVMLNYSASIDLKCIFKNSLLLNLGIDYQRQGLRVMNVSFGSTYSLGGAWLNNGYTKDYSVIYKYISLPIGFGYRFNFSKKLSMEGTLGSQFSLFLDSDVFQNSTPTYSNGPHNQYVFGFYGEALFGAFFSEKWQGQIGAKYLQNLDRSNPTHHNGATLPELRLSSIICKLRISRTF